MLCKIALVLKEDFYDLNNKQALFSRALYGKASLLKKFAFAITLDPFIVNIFFKTLHHCKTKRNFKCKLLQLFIELVGCVYRNGITIFALDWEPVAPIYVLARDVLPLRTMHHQLNCHNTILATNR